MPAHIGLIGGIGPAATDFYYRKIIAAYAELGLELELTIALSDCGLRCYPCSKSGVCCAE